MRRMWILLLTLSCQFYVAVRATSYVDPLDSFTDSLLREVLGRMGGDPDENVGGRSPLFSDYEPPLVQQQGKAFEARREPSIRDQEYLEHSSLFGNQYAGGAGQGLQRQKPDGSLITPLKNSGALPAYCIPPNPCPAGYTVADGCLQHFVNTADFSRDYQANQKCMCDSEHMFDCPGSTRETEIDALARTFENEDLAEVALDRLIKTMEPLNPLLEGEKLPVVAKKAPSLSAN